MAVATILFSFQTTQAFLWPINLRTTIPSKSSKQTRKPSRPPKNGRPPQKKKRVTVQYSWWMIRFIVLIVIRILQQKQIIATICPRIDPKKSRWSMRTKGALMFACFMIIIGRGWSLVGIMIGKCICIRFNRRNERIIIYL